MLLVPDSYFFIQDALKYFCHTLWHVHSPKNLLNVIHEMMQYGVNGLPRHKQYLDPTTGLWWRGFKII